MSLSGKVCVVTGASSGIGHRIASDLASARAKVCAVARRVDRLEALVADMGGSGAGHSYVATDVSDRGQVAALAKHVEATYGRCDVLVNNAGYSEPGGFSSEEGIERVERVMATNFFGAVYCTGELLPLLRRSAPASIVNVASVAGRIAVPGNDSYCASKFALIGWSESLYFDLEEQGIVVSLVEPGFIPTDGFPQSDLVNDPVLKHALGSVEGVSKAVMNAIDKNKAQRVTPRWYYLLQVPKLVSPPLYRLAVRKLVAPRQKARAEKGEV
jgi:uncharacterized protein